MTRLNQSGVGHVVAVLLLLVVAVVGFTGYKVYSAQHKDTVAETTEKTAVSKSAAPEIKQADQTLNQVNDDLDSSLDTAALDQDIDAML